MPRSAWELFKQQRLHAWQPILTPTNVAIGFLIISVLFIPIGSVVLISNRGAKDFSFRYDEIHRCTAANNTGSFTFQGNGATLRTGCLTRFTFEISQTLKAPVYLYYGLTNFYQNHRRYANSRSDPQFAGHQMKANEMSDASPLVKPGDVNGMSGVPINFRNLTARYEDFVYIPSGLIAWSMFNDTFTLYKNGGKSSSDLILICNGTDFARNTNLPLGGSQSPNQCTKKGIAWSSDVDKKFKAPSPEALLQQSWSAPINLYMSSPPTQPLSNDSYLNNGWYAGELGHNVPVTTDEDLMVWMRSASLPSFRKLYRIIQTDLTPGRYVMEIAEFYDVTSFGGSKSFMLSTLSWIGGRNTFLGLTYVVTGGIAMAFALLLAVVNRFGGDRASKSIDELLKK